MEHLLKHVREYWFIIVFLGMVVLSWSAFTERLSSLERRVAEVEQAILAFDQVRIDIAVIKEKLINIERKIQ